MPANRFALHMVLAITAAATVVSFSNHLHAQQCRMAHDADALRAMQIKAASGDADAQCGLGRQYEFALGVPKDLKQSVFWLQKSGDQGNIVAEVELGIVFDQMQDPAGIDLVSKSRRTRQRKS